MSEDPYGRLQTRLADGLQARGVVALPDGSVDRYFEVEGATGERIPTREAFLDRVGPGHARSLQLDPAATRAGGQAVNAARQVDALGGEVTLYGHLDAPELDSLPFETHSMGDPATVHVLDFEEESLMLSVESGDIRGWTASDLFEAIAVDPDAWIRDEVLVVGNWVGVSGLTGALERLAEVDLGRGTVVFDPGDLTGAAPASLDALCEAIATLGDATAVVLTGNDGELERIARILGVRDGPDREEQVRAELGVEAVVLHTESHAHAAVAPGESVTAPNYTADEVIRRTGAGDHFTGGLATGLAASLPWRECLALSNACATHLVETGGTATREDLLALVEERDPE